MPEFDDLPPMDFEADATADLEQSDEGIKSLSNLVKAMDKAQKDITALEQELRLKEKALFLLSTVTIPEKMKELGVELFKTDDGVILESKTVVKASISEKNKPAAFKWLEEQGVDDMIKTEVKIKLGKGERWKAKKIREFCEAKLAVIPDEKDGVHFMTLSAFARERLENKQPLATDLLGVFTYDQSKLKVPGVPAWKRIFAKK